MSQRTLLYINSTHYIPNSNNSYRLPLARAVELDRKCSLSLYSFSVYNSSFNISAQFANNWFSVKWIDGTERRTTIPDGYYSVSDLNAYLQSFFFQQGWYATSSSNAVYFASFSTNATRYKNQIDLFVIPSASVATTLGYKASMQGGFTSFPTNPSQIQLTLAPKLASIYFGMPNQSVFPSVLPDVAANQTFLSTVAPTISPTFSYLLTCNWLPTGINSLPVLAQIPIDSGFGKLVHISGLYPARIATKSSTFNSLDISLWSQDGSVPARLEDTEISIVLILEHDDH